MKNLIVTYNGNLNLCHENFYKINSIKIHYYNVQWKNNEIIFIRVCIIFSGAFHL